MEEKSELGEKFIAIGLNHLGNGIAWFGFWLFLSVVVYSIFN